MARRTDEDFADEVNAHIDLETDRLIADGVEPAAARAQATRTFGNVLGARERFYESRRWIIAERVIRDLRYGWRSLQKSPAFLGTTVATLGVGLGLVTALFTIFNAYVLRPFAVREPHSLHQLVWHTPTAGGYQFRWREFEHLRTRRDLVDDVLASTTRVVLVDERPMVALFVSGNYFQSLAPAMRLGRGIGPADAAVPAAGAVAVLTDEGWARLFGRDPRAVGQQVALNRTAHEIVGVLRPEFSGLDDTPRDLVVPLTMLAPVAGTDIHGAAEPRELALVLRLRAGVTPRQAEAALGPFVTQTVARPEAVRTELRWLATPNPVTADMLMALSPVFAAFVLVLVAACANVSNIMLARANARHREIAMRLSLGATRAQIVQQLTAEGAIIAVAAAVAGLILAALTLRVGVRLFVEGLPSSVAALVRVAPLDLDLRVFGFTLAVAAISMLLFALVPAFHATRLTLTDALRGHATAAPRGSRLRNLLVVSQVAVSLVLLIAAGTLVRNGVSMQSRDVGFDTRGRFVVLPGQDRSGEVRGAAEALLADPRMASVAATSVIPFSERLARVPVEPTPGAQIVPTSYKFVAPSYFAALDIPILEGRGFTDTEAHGELPVGIVSAAGARVLWPGRSPLGQTIRLPIAALDVEAGNRQSGALPAATPVVEVTIVGVARDAVNGLLIEGIDPAHVYLPTSAAGRRAATLVVTGRGVDVTADLIRSLLRPLDEDPLAFDVYTMDSLREQQLFPITAASWIGSALGAIAVALSVAGLYGVLIYLLGQRTREIGIRMALGASRAAIARLVATQSARLAVTGATIGVVAATGVLWGLGAMVPLRNVTWVDVPAIAIGLALVGVATALATVVPTWRAARIDPAQTLRADG